MITTNHSAALAGYSGNLDRFGERVFDNLKANASALPLNAWEEVDKTLIEVFQRVPVALNDLRAKGLVGRPMGLGVLYKYYQMASDTTDAEVSMDANTKSKEDSEEFDSNGVPIPVIHKGWSINGRMLEGGRRYGLSLDTRAADKSAEKVAKAIDNMIVNGSSIKSKALSIYGYTTFPNRIQKTISVAWDDAGKTPALCLADVLAWVKGMDDNNIDGPYTLYLPSNYMAILREDYGTDGTAQALTLEDRIMRIKEIEAIKKLPSLAADNVVLVQLINRNIEVVVGVDVMNVEWSSGDKLTTYMKTFAAMAPMLKADFNSKIGLMHVTVA